MPSRLPRWLVALGLAWAVLIVAHFPWGVDQPHEPVELLEEADNFYETAYETPADGPDSQYVLVARTFAAHADVQPELEAFIRRNGLQKAKALEIGAGSGTLQDVVEDYTGLDIASSARRYFHKPFVHGSATDLPFPDQSFDLVFSIWTYEHAPNPERAFAEARRVVRDDGWLYLEPAWNNPTWAPHGWPVRHDRTLGPLELVRKYSLLIREITWFKSAYRIPVRVLRRLATAAGPTRLRFREVDGNFETYWMPDADAVNSIDCYEAALWFSTRGDQVTLNGDPMDLLAACNDEAVIVRVRK